MPDRWLMLIVIFLARLAMGFQFQSVASSASILASEFGFSYAQIGTLIGLFLIPGIVVAIPGGLVTRLATDKMLLLSGAAMLCLGAVLMGVSTSPGWLFCGRMLGGVGGVLFNIIMTKMVSDWFEGRELIGLIAAAHFTQDLDQLVVLPLEGVARRLALEANDVIRCRHGGRLPGE